MSTILGFHSHNLTGAALIKDGKIISAVNEERLDRVKNSQAFPEKSIREVLKEGNLKNEDIDIIALGDLKYSLPNINEYTKRLILYPKYYRSILGRAKHIWHMKNRCTKTNYEYIRKNFPNKKAENIEHHVGHAASAHFTSGNDKNLIVTIDGWGDKISNGAFIGNNEKIEKLYSSSDLDSMGYFYSRITVALGFKAHRHEGKITGLAGYGKPTEELMELMNNIGSFDEKNMKFKFNISELYFPTLDMDKRFIEFISKFKPADVAAAAQKFLEDNVRKYITALIDKIGSQHLVCAGGTFANVKMNQVIKNVPGVKSIFIHPNMGDEGLCLGSALKLYNDKTGYMNVKLKDVYFGPEFTNQEIKAELEKTHLKYQYLEDIEYQVAELLAKGKVVARFSGRMEYGPRALGNRTILYQTQDKSVNDWLNKKLHRCYDSQTEILTMEGWKYIKDISEKEKVATLNPNKNTLEFQKIEKKISYNYKGEMYSLKNKRIDLLVTPNHNMWIKRKHSTKFEFKKIDDVAKIKTYHYQKKGGVEWGGVKKEFFTLPGTMLRNKKVKNVKIPMNIWLEFFGYFLSEGWTYNDGYGHYITGIGQSKKSKYFKDMQECLKKLPFNFHYDKKQFIISNKQLYNHLKNFGKAKGKYIPNEIKKLSKEQLIILFKSLMKGDGNIRGKGYRYATTSKKLADSIQEMSLKIGLTAYISIQKKSKNPVHNTLYMVRIGRSHVSTVRSHQIKKEKYNGKVYCVTVPNHILYARRNGKGVFSGNTEFMPFAPVTIAKYVNKCYSDIKGAEYAAKFMTITFDCTDWMKENCPGVVHVDGTARPQLIEESDNPSYFKIVDEYRKITGIPCLINTSFNMHEEPIVCSPYDAIRAFMEGGLDYLAIGNYLVKGREYSKKDSITTQPKISDYTVL